MKTRLNYAEVAPNALKTMLELEKYVHASKLERPRYELVKTRASQINGCANGLDMHTTDKRTAGETVKGKSEYNA